MNDERKINIYLAIGHPGSGKSSLLNEISKKLNVGGNGEIHWVNEYDDHIFPIIKRLLKEKKKFKDGEPLVKGTIDGWILDPRTYEVLLPSVAVSIANEIHSQQKDGCEEIMFEAARNVGKPRMGYGDGLIDPLTKRLEDLGVKPNISLVVVDGGNKEQLWKRMEDRYEADETGKVPPPEILNNYYFDENGMPLEAKKSLNGREGDFLILKFDNTGPEEKLKEGILEVVRQLNLNGEDEISHGVERH